MALLDRADGKISEEHFCEQISLISIRMAREAATDNAIASDGVPTLGAAARPRKKRWEYWDRQHQKALKKAKELDIHNCIMCAQPHEYDFEVCKSERCLFCKRRIKAKGAHISITCSEAPSNKKQLKMAFDGKA